MNDIIRKKLALLPLSPGCYLMKNAQGEIIYVGKSKSLKNRVKSYFTGAHDGKTALLVSEIEDFEYIVTSSELEALLLEINMIKKYDPQYNIKLRDDKTYPYIMITADKHPKIVTIRKTNKRVKKAKFFGPYPNGKAANEIVRILNKIYPLRKCHKIPKSACLYYHIGQCLAPCTKEVSSTDYDDVIKEITQFLNGNTKVVVSKIEDRMLKAAERLEFERANEYKELLVHVNTIVEKQKMILNDFKNRDVIAYTTYNGYMNIQIFYVRNGLVQTRDSATFPYYDDKAEAFMTYLIQLYEKLPNKPDELLVQSEDICGLLTAALGVKTINPKVGDKKKLIDLALENAEIALKDKFALVQADEVKKEKALQQLSELLNIPHAKRIEMFDNSHISGSDSVSALVVFDNGFKNKQEYRTFKLTDTGADDFAAMKEVIYRRYYRLLMEDKKMPSLIIVDGGKSQVSAAKQILNDLAIDVRLVGLVKDDKHRTFGILDSKTYEVIELDKKSPLFYFLVEIQEEVHRFAISFHRVQRSKRLTRSSLDEIDGVGPVTKKKLLKHFGSLKKIKEANLNEITALGISEKVAENIKTLLK